MRVNLNQNVIARVLTLQQRNLYQVPKLPEASVNIILPPLLSLRTIADKMKSMSNLITLAANNAGQLQLRIQSETLSVETKFEHLQNPAGKDLNQCTHKPTSPLTCIASYLPTRLPPNN